MTRSYKTLDGIRGLAAIIIVMRHAHAYFNGLSSPESFLAVDLFFVLSGFVLGHAYQKRLDGDMLTAEFMTVRVVRFFPLYLLGLLGGALVATLAIVSGHGDLSWLGLAVAMALGLVFLPTPMPGATGEKMFPLNDPSWSLFLELLANAAMAIFWRRLGNRALMTVVAVTSLGLAIAVLRVGLPDVGFRWAGLGLGLLRVAFSFFAGLLIYRLRDRIHLSVHPLVALATVAFALLYTPPESLRAGFALIWILAGFPLLIAAASDREPTFGAGWFSFLGVTSYGAYVLHYPLQSLVRGAFQWATGRDVSEFAPWSGVVFLGTLLMLCWALDRFYDAPFRRWLSSSADQVARRFEVRKGTAPTDLVATDRKYALTPPP